MTPSQSPVAMRDRKVCTLASREIGRVGRQQLGTRVQFHELPDELFVCRLWHDKDRFVRQPQTLSLLGGRNHRGSLAETDLMGQQYGPVDHATVNRVALVRAHLLLPLHSHAGEALV